MSSRVKSGASSPTLTGSVRFGSSFGLPRTPRAVPAVVMLATSSTSAEMTNDNFAVLLFICFSLRLECCGWNLQRGDIWRARRISFHWPKSVSFCLLGHWPELLSGARCCSSPTDFPSGASVARVRYCLPASRSARGSTDHRTCGRLAWIPLAFRWLAPCSLQREHLRGLLYFEPAKRCRSPFYWARLCTRQPVGSSVLR